MNRLSPGLAGLIAGLILATGGVLPVRAEVPVQAYEVVRAYPHDRTAFTQGLLFHEGALYESTGQYPSSIRQVRLEPAGMAVVSLVRPFTTKLWGRLFWL